LSHRKYKVNRLSLTDQVYSIIKEQIISGEIKSGEKISVDGLARGLETSKTPIREALNKLIGENLVINTGKNKMEIVKLSLDDVSKISDLRQALEILALREGFPNIEKEELIANLKLLKESKVELERGNAEKFIASDIDLHEIIIKSSNNKWLLQIIMQLKSLIDVVRNTYPSLNRYKVSISEHKELVEAMINGDEEKSIKILNKHLENIKNRILKAAADNKI
jgi:DNA-binding GntR family transcriptional regulator